MTISKLEQKKLQADIARRAIEVAAPLAPRNNLEQKQAEARSGVHDYVNYSEIRRIIGMPIVFDMDSREYEVYCKNNILASAYDGGFRLYHVQAEAVAAFELYNGLFAPIGVGWGKTLIGLMVANKAYMSGTRKIVLLIPSELLPQLVNTDIPWARVRVPISYPIHVIGGKDMRTRRALCKSQRKGLYIVPYSLLSTQDSVDNLNEIKPDLVICDEGHNLKNRKAARTNRLFNMIEGRKPAGVCMSGTVTQKTIKDYYHLAKWCLNRHCPLPLSTHLANDWAVVLDSAAMQGGNQWVSETNAGPLRPLIDWARARFPSGGPFDESVAGFRKAYEVRFRTAPGVVSSGDSDIGTSLVMCNRPVTVNESYPGYKKLEELGKQVTEQWITPNGDEIEHSIHLWKWLNEIYGAGFYNELKWPEPDALASRKSIGLAEATDILEASKEHHNYGQIYAKCLRGWIDKKAKPGMDTPFLIGSEMSRNKHENVGAELYGHWQDWKDLDFDGRPDRDGKAIRVCDFKIQAAVTWASQYAATEKGCIIWYYHQAIGLWLKEELERRLPANDILHCPAGNASNSAIIDKKHGNKIVLASITAHGTGKNLQHFEHQYFMQWMRQAHISEQAIGRTHRNGQMADELRVFTNITSLFDQLNFAACLNDALYIQQTTGTRQKIIYCDYDPLPKIFPASVLRERGLQPQMLSAQMQTELQEKFGNG